MSALDDIIKAAVKQAAKKASQTASKTAAKKVAAKTTAKTAKKVVAKTTKKVASKANPKNSYALGRTVVHGSPVRGLKTITPKKGSKALPDESVVFVWDPKDFSKRGLIANSVKSYTQNSGSVYIGKVPRSGYKKTIHGVGASSKPMKVKKEIIDTNKIGDIDKGLERGLLRHGAIKKPTKAGAKSKVKKVTRKVENVARKNKKVSSKLTQIQNKNSVV
jgi:hypothetical protein